MSRALLVVAAVVLAPVAGAALVCIWAAKGRDE